MKIDCLKKAGREMTLVSILMLSSVIMYGSEAIARGQGGENGGGAGNSQGRGAGNSLGSRAELSGAENASDTAREHAAHDSAVILADPNHFADGHTH